MSGSESASDYYSIHKETIPVNNTQYSTDWLPTIVWDKAGATPVLSSNARFRVFVPPGALQLNLLMYTQFQPSVKAVVRFGQVPDCVNCTPSQTEFTQGEAIFFEEFEKKDVHLQNTGGQIAIYQKSLQRAPNAFTAAPAITQGGWLYVYVYDQAYAVGQIQYAVKVDTALYTDWYNNYDRVNDPYGLLSGSPVSPPIVSPPGHTYEDGINFCIKNPDLCGIIKIDDNYNIQLNSVKFPNSFDPTDPTSQNRYDIKLKLESPPNKIEWGLDLTDPDNFLLSTSNRG